MESDTIVAVVTPPGEGGVGIVRASGPLSPALPAQLFPRLRGQWRSHQLRQGELVDPIAGVGIDQAAGCLMLSPRSYTGEDIFEIHCHGSPVLLKRVVSICLREGCRAARPGEFTLRAFLAGRIDLTQAEAVLDLVRARTNAGLEMAATQLTGWLRERIEPLRYALVGTLAHIEAMVDFVEDDIPPQLDHSTQIALRNALEIIESLLIGSEQGIILREGATLAIVGSPNVGKSSIMNALLGVERSIVTPIAGTTRDTIEEEVQIRGIPFRIIDTAGITRSDDVVERKGIERSRQALAAADVVLLVLDRSRHWNDKDVMAVQALEAALADEENGSQNPRIVVALNKSDLPSCLDTSEALSRINPIGIASSCALQPGGIDELRSMLEIAALGGNRQDWVVANVRHQDALRRAARRLGVALDGLVSGVPLDLISFDVRDAVQALGEITGTNVDDELLDRIFRDFCIGK